ncbi:MAG: hypothetical protein WCO13_09845 [Bacteroidota bacterium]
MSDGLRSAPEVTKGSLSVQRENVYIVTAGGAAGIQSGLILAKLP